MRAKNKGFTLIELMIIIAIIGILAATALPTYKQYTKKTRFSEVIVAASAVKNAIDICFQTIANRNLQKCDTFAKSNIDVNSIITAQTVSTVTITPLSNSARPIVITATGTTTVDNLTYILTGTPSNGTISWSITGSCISAKAC